MLRNKTMQFSISQQTFFPNTRDEIMTKSCISLGDSTARLCYAPKDQIVPVIDGIHGFFRRPVGAWDGGLHDPRGCIPFGDFTAGLCSYAPLGQLSCAMHTIYSLFVAKRFVAMRYLSCIMHTIFRSVTDPKGRQIIARGFIPWINMQNNR